MSTPFEISQFNIIEFLGGLILWLISFTVIAFQFRPSIFPVPKRQRVWRAILVSIMLSVSILGILIIADAIYVEALLTRQVFIPLFCIALPPTFLIVTVSVYFQYQFLGKLFSTVLKKYNNDIK